MSTTVGPALVTFTLLFSMAKYMIIFNGANHATLKIAANPNEISIPVVVTAVGLVVISLLMQEIDSCSEPMPNFSFWILGVSMIIVVFDSVDTPNKPGAWASMVSLIYIITVYDHTSVWACNMWMAIFSIFGLYVHVCLMFNHLSTKPPRPVI